MKLNFIINEYFLLTKALQRSYKSKKDPFWKPWHILDEKLWKKLNNSLFYQLINPGDYGLYTSLEVSNPKAEKIYKNLIKQTKNEFKKIFKTPPFKKLMEETQAYSKTVQQRWSKKEKDIYSFLEQITGLKIPNLKPNIIIVHPKLSCGRSYSEIQSIVWGHKEDWNSYSTVYLAHELLHLIFDYYKIPLDDLSHSLIELISDNELRFFLNKGGKYFKENDISVGHDNLRSIEKKILPYWKKYLKQNKKNIIEFYTQMKNI